MVVERAHLEASPDGGPFLHNKVEGFGVAQPSQKGPYTYHNIRMGSESWGGGGVAKIPLLTHISPK